MPTEECPTQEIKSEDIKPGVDITEQVTLEGLKPMFPKTRYVLSAEDVNILYIEIHAKPKEDGEEQEIGHLSFKLDLEQLHLPKLTLGFGDLCELLDEYPDACATNAAAVIMVHLLAQRDVRLRIGFKPETYHPNPEDHDLSLEDVELEMTLTIGDTVIEPYNAKESLWGSSQDGYILFDVVDTRNS